ncbi:hypothetical protein scyTo_0003087 [Scyliorhinus torazame]|uniref:Reverse transcriptase domain-containing protein n=1 Tax=Scyliorhinus torazame TaxID=75743 RepID=A0A401PLL9_SCYTO|nr:hypothetical protein [Scyliorhinus torazame]
MVNQIAQYRVFSTVDLKSAYHQLPICKSNRPYTAFEADGRLYHFLRHQRGFGLPKGDGPTGRPVRFAGHVPYLDNVTIYGHDQQDHDANLAKFLRTTTLLNLKYNKEKCVFRTNRLTILGYVVQNGVLEPVPDRMRPLMELPLPHCPKALKRCLGFFSYYAQWVPNYANKPRPLIQSTHFPLMAEAQQAFARVRADIAKAGMHTVD